MWDLLARLVHSKGLLVSPMGRGDCRQRHRAAGVFSEICFIWCVFMILRLVEIHKDFDQFPESEKNNEIPPALQIQLF